MRTNLALLLCLSVLLSGCMTVMTNQAIEPVGLGLFGDMAIAGGITFLIVVPTGLDAKWKREDPQLFHGFLPSSETNAIFGIACLGIMFTDAVMMLSYRKAYYEKKEAEEEATEPEEPSDVIE